MKRVTIVDVAKHAGVAISSVSSALNDRPGVSEATRQRIMQAAQELGYVASLRGKALSGRKAYAIGLVVHRDPEVFELDPFFGAFIGGIEEMLDRSGFALVLQSSATPEDDLERYRRLSADRRVDGVILNELTTDDPRVALVQELGLPAFGINPDPGFPLPHVRQDHESGIRDLLGALTAAGHRTIGHLAGPGDYVHSRQRERVWRGFLAEHDLTPGPVIDAAFTYEGGIAAAETLLSLPGALPTAMFCANDLSALGFIAELQRRGVEVPADLSVVGFDGIQLGEFVPPRLTSVRASARRVGHEAARILLEVIDGDSPEPAVVEAATPVWRDSIAPTRARRP